MSADEPRPELAELQRRTSLTTDAARPEAVRRWHAAGRRTARENLEDLVDPGSFIEYGRFATAAQEDHRQVADLIESTPADGIVGGLARIGGEAFGNRAACAVFSYDYLVLAGTQGVRGHLKTDRLFDVVERLGLPVVCFAEGGGGRPGDTNYPVASALHVPSFARWAALSGRSLRIAIVSGRCFAGNAVIAGSADLIIATVDANLGMAGPAMIAGGGLGQVAAEDIGPVTVQARNGVIDLVAADEAEAVAAAKRLLGYVQGPLPEYAAPDQDAMRTIIPERDRAPFDTKIVITTLADYDCVTFLREAFAPELLTALIRIEGHPVGVIANQSMTMAGAITSDGADKAARFLRLCDAFGIPIVSLVDTPGMMVGPEAEATGLVRHTSRLLVAGATLGVPLIGVVLRRGYGLGAQAMLGGSTHEPLLTIAWPGAHLGPMGLEGAIRLARRKELAAIADPAAREARVKELTAAYALEVGALNVARHVEIDDVIDPAETRGVIARTLALARDSGACRPSGRPVDPW